MSLHVANCHKRSLDFHPPFRRQCPSAQAPSPPHSPVPLSASLIAPQGAAPMIRSDSMRDSSPANLELVQSHHRAHVMLSSRPVNKPGKRLPHSPVSKRQKRSP